MKSRDKMRRPPAPPIEVVTEAPIDEAREAVLFAEATEREREALEAAINDEAKGGD